jgi:threonine dehydrogenase-like Zn-dependent dehydrogenase
LVVEQARPDGVLRLAVTAAAVVDGPRSARLATVARPAPGPAEVLVQVAGCGVCGSNVPVWQGEPWTAYPLEAGGPGHEVWGTLEDGTSVTALSYRGFAEHDVAAVNAVVTLPAELAGTPFPGEAVGCAVNVFRRAEIRPGDTVAVVGVGFLGALLVRLAADAGARVLAFARRDYALEVARAQGAAEALPLHAAGAYEESCDVVVEAAGVQATLDAATRLVRTRGRLVVAGYHQDAARTVDMQTWNWRGLHIVNAHERDPAVCVDGMRIGVELAARGVLDVASLVTHTFPLARIGDALDAALERPDGFLKAVVVP